MRLTHLSARDFRNLEHVELAISPRFTVLHGHNGAGKTNVLEALYLVSTLRSFRSAELATLVRHERARARVDVRGHIPGLGVSSSLSVALERGARSTRRTAQADGKTVRSGADFYGRLPAILFTPEDLGILRGSPGGRRRFLDRVLFARDKTHISDVQAYEKLVRSRNQVLRNEGDRLGRRSSGGSAAELDRLLTTYETRLAAVGARIWTRRAQLIETLRPNLREVFAQVHGSEPAAEIDYRPHVLDLERGPRDGAPSPESREDALLRGLAARRELDLMRRTTSVGPHRDDFEMTLAGQSAAKYASQGQSRALVLAFKIAELQTSRAALGRAPILLLDDVSSELDPTRTEQLFEALAREVGQCVLTTTSRRYIPLRDDLERAYFSVDGGLITPDASAR